MSKTSSVGRDRVTRLGFAAFGLMLAGAGFVLIVVSEVVAAPGQFQRSLDRTGSSLLLAGAVVFVAARWS